MVALFVSTFAAIMGGVVAYMVWSHRDRSVPVGFGASRVVLNGKVTVDQVREALQTADIQLLWHAPAIYNRDCAKDLYIVVRPDNVWTDQYGRRIGGQSIPGAFEVGRDLSAMCHELAHVMEYKTLGTPDTTHASWEAKGVWVADRTFRAWRDAQKWEL